MAFLHLGEHYAEALFALIFKFLSQIRQATSEKYFDIGLIGDSSVSILLCNSDYLIWELRLKKRNKIFYDLKASPEASSIFYSSSKVVL